MTTCRNASVGGGTTWPTAPTVPVCCASVLVPTSPQNPNALSPALVRRTSPSSLTKPWLPLQTKGKLVGSPNSSTLPATHIQNLRLLCVCRCVSKVTLLPVARRSSRAKNSQKFHESAMRAAWWQSSNMLRFLKAIVVDGSKVCLRSSEEVWWCGDEVVQSEEARHWACAPKSDGCKTEWIMMRPSTAATTATSQDDDVGVLPFFEDWRKAVGVLRCVRFVVRKLMVSRLFRDEKKIMENKNQFSPNCDLF